MSSLPNWHPFFVHFPIALFTFAFFCDVSLLVRFRISWLDRAVVLLYVASAFGALAAAISGKLAADSMIERLEPSVSDAVALHGDWAFFAAIAVVVTAALRFDTTWRDRDHEHPVLHRARLIAFAAAAVALGVLIHTAGRGGELVYRHGVAIEP